MPFTQVRDIKVYFEMQGSGPRLLYFNGSGGDLRRKPNIFDTPLAEHFQILAHDQRGLGQTDRPDIPYTMADYADDAAALLDAVGWDSCHILGISFGGMVGQEFALRHPERINRLILGCTSSGGAGGASYPLHELSHLGAEERIGRIISLADTRNDATWQAANPEQYQAMVQQSLAGNEIGADEPGRAIGARRQIEARAGHDTYNRLPQLQMPVYICGGRFDAIASPANQEAMAEQIPNATMELFEGGHLFFRQDPRAFERMSAFLQGEV